MTESAPGFIQQSNVLPKHALLFQHWLSRILRNRLNNLCPPFRLIIQSATNICKVHPAQCQSGQICLATPGAVSTAIDCLWQLQREMASSKKGRKIERTFPIPLNGPHRIKQILTIVG